LKKSLLSRVNNWFVFTLLTLIVAGLAISSNFLINHLREKESERIKSLATAMKYLQDSGNFDSRLNELSLYVINENENIPIIRTDKNRNLIDSKNISEDILKNPEKLKRKIYEMESKYPPFEIQLPNYNNQFVFYDNSDMLNQLRYYPYALVVFIGAYLLFSFWFLKTIKKSDESMLWAGLAKETAHQIGTPLSSMIGWIEILKMQKENNEGVLEIQKDVNRLKTISERFSKIGSVPELNDLNLKETVKQNFDYLKTRISKKVVFDLIVPSDEVLIPHNRILMSWVIENLVKNAVDAMKGEGKLDMILCQKNDNILIDVKDSGSGMTKAQIRNAFRPGYSTKKRGWGLGLSLAKRVIKEYHNGDIKIAESEVGEGTVFRIILKS
jgi:two-component sensor histidine kinase